MEAMESKADSSQEFSFQAKVTGVLNCVEQKESEGWAKNQR